MITETFYEIFEMFRNRQYKVENACSAELKTKEKYGNKGDKRILHSFLTEQIKSTILENKQNISKFCDVQELFPAGKKGSYGICLSGK